MNDSDNTSIETFDERREPIVGAPTWSTCILPVWTDPSTGLCVVLCRGQERVLQVVDGQMEPSLGTPLRNRVPANAVAALLRRAGVS